MNNELIGELDKMLSCAQNFNLNILAFNYKYLSLNLTEMLIDELFNELNNEMNFELDVELEVELEIITRNLK